MRHRVLLVLFVAATLVQCCICFASADLNSVEGRILEIAKIRRLRGAGSTPQEERGLLDAFKRIFSSPFLEKEEMQLRRMIHAQPMGDSLPHDHKIMVPPDRPSPKQFTVAIIAALSMLGALVEDIGWQLEYVLYLGGSRSFQEPLDLVQLYVLAALSFSPDGRVYVLCGRDASACEEADDGSAVEVTKHTIVDSIVTFKLNLATCTPKLTPAHCHTCNDIAPAPPGVRICTFDVKL
uniref:Uncharacterized protein n=1 Tax=Peronospora matthiolae TaxID=2874970 RepID=A0AAV1TF11_9STRA